MNTMNTEEYAKLLAEHKTVLQEHNALLKKHLDAQTMLGQHKKLLEDHNALLKKHMDALNELEAARGELTEVKDLTLTYMSDELDKLYTAICDDTDAHFIKMCEEIYEDKSYSVFRKYAALDRLYASHLRNAEKRLLEIHLAKVQDAVSAEASKKKEKSRLDLALEKEVMDNPYKKVCICCKTSLALSEQIPTTSGTYMCHACSD